MGHHGICYTFTPCFNHSKYTIMDRRVVSVDYKCKSGCNRLDGKPLTIYCASIRDGHHGQLIQILTHVAVNDNM